MHPYFELPLLLNKVELYMIGDEFKVMSPLGNKHILVNLRFGFCQGVLFQVEPISWWLSRFNGGSSTYHDRSSFNFGNQLLKDLPVFDASTIGITFYDAVYLENIFDHNLKGMRFPLITIFGSTYIA
ncbi:hypothetical protein BLOT_009850 [Blomia tropicalis]|nr:hypothetical protein BLOT_015664 [Blomia tropicalis]KAI2802401.1 hypothetical protein BLOT_009850 [Blomia tropicalis]